MTAPTRRAPALLRTIGEHFSKLSQRLHADDALSDADATKYAVRALTDAGFRVTEERVVRKTHRPFKLAVSTAIWLVGAAVTAALVRLVIAPYYSDPLGGDLGTLAIALGAWTYALDRWLRRPNVSFESTNIVAVRGDPRIWLLGDLTPDEPPVTRLRMVERIVVAPVGLLYLAANPSFDKLKGVIIGVTIYAALHSALAYLFRARSRTALSPVSGAAAILGAADQLAPGTTSVGIILTRGSGIGQGADFWPSEIPSYAESIVVKQVGGPEGLQSHYSKGTRAVARQLELAAERERIKYEVHIVPGTYSGLLPATEVADRRYITLFRPKDPAVFRHLFEWIFTREEHGREFDLLGQIAHVSRMLAYFLEGEPKEHE